MAGLAIWRRGTLPFRAFEADLHGHRCVHVTEATLADGRMPCVLTDISELGADERTLRSSATWRCARRCPG